MWIGVAEEAKFGPGYKLKVFHRNQIFFKVDCCLGRGCSTGVPATSPMDRPWSLATGGQSLLQGTILG